MGLNMGLKIVQELVWVAKVQDFKLNSGMGQVYGPLLLLPTPNSDICLDKRLISNLDLGLGILKKCLDPDPFHPYR